MLLLTLSMIDNFYRVVSSHRISYICVDQISNLFGLNVREDYGKFLDKKEITLQLLFQLFQCCSNDLKFHSTVFFDFTLIQSSVF